MNLPQPAGVGIPWRTIRLLPGRGRGFAGLCLLGLWMVVAPGASASEAAPPPPPPSADHGTPAPDAHANPAAPAAPDHGTAPASASASAAHGDEAHEPPSAPAAAAHGAESAADHGAVHATATDDAHPSPQPPASAAHGAPKPVNRGAGPRPVVASDPSAAADIDALLDSFVDPARKDPAETDAMYRNFLEQSRRERREGKPGPAANRLIAILRSPASDEFKRPALFELALLAQDEGNLARALQIFSQYLQRFPKQPGVIEAYLRQGIICRQMGASSQALSKFYAAMTSALSLELNELEYYQRLVLQAQLEIADTYYLDGRWDDAIDFLQRLQKLDSPYLDLAAVRYKLIRAFAAKGRVAETVGQAQTFLDQHPRAVEVPEVRFTLASMLKKQGRKEESLKQVLLLLEGAQATAERSPQAWAYWQKRAGNEIANELYREGDYLGTLQIYQRLVQLDQSAEWQLPVLYQVGLVYERLNQPARAGEAYQKLLARKPEVTGTNGTPAMAALVEMAEWRQNHLAWLQNAMASAAALRQAIPAPSPTKADETPPGNR